VRGVFIIMAKRRMLSQNIIYDEDFNSLSIEAQWLFTRMLIITDDCGVVPASNYNLKTMCNLPDKIYSKLQNFLYELINAKLIQGFVYEGKKYFCFKKDTFDDYQAFIIKNRTRSEYLKMDKDSYLEFYNSLQEITINYSNFFDNESYHIESKEQRVKSKELKAKSKEQKDGKLTFFKDAYSDKISFKIIFENNEDYKIFDTDYYYESALNWSNSNGKKKIDWIATTRNWALRDLKDGKPKLKKQYEQQFNESKGSRLFDNIEKVREFFRNKENGN
jgi:hypothetical protein